MSQQVTFCRTVSPWPELRSLIPTLLFLSLLVAAFAWMLVEAFEGENATLYACIAGPACFVAVIAFKHWQLSSVNKSTTLTLDAEGLRRTDGETVTYAKWADVTRLTNQNTTLAMKPGTAGSANAAASAAMNSAKVVRLSIMARGFAHRVPTKNPLRILLVAHRHGLFSSKPKQMDTLIFVPSQFENNWVEGTIGAYLRRYRPDIALPARST